MGWSRFPILWSFLLLSAFEDIRPPLAPAVTCDCDDQNRLTPTALQNGTPIQYTDDPVGNRLSRNIFSPSPLTYPLNRF